MAKYEIRPDGTIITDDPVLARELASRFARPLPPPPRSSEPTRYFREEPAPPAQPAEKKHEDARRSQAPPPAATDSIGRLIKALDLVRQRNAITSSELANELGFHTPRGLAAIQRVGAPLLEKHGMEWADVVKIGRDSDGSYWTARPRLEEAIRLLQSRNGTGGPP